MRIVDLLPETLNRSPSACPLSSLFLFAALHTTSSLLSRLFHLLALHPEAQARLRAEVTNARAQGGDLPYEALDALPFLDALIRETLRV